MSRFTEITQPSLESLWQHEHFAQAGSTTLAREINKLRAKGLTDEQPQRPPMSFEEQLAAVERGARIIEWAPPRIEPQRTLGGCVGEIL